jgi:hypothetical protein
MVWKFLFCPGKFCTGFWIAHPLADKATPRIGLKTLRVMRASSYIAGNIKHPHVMAGNGVKLFTWRLYARGIELLGIGCTSTVPDGLTVFIAPARVGSGVVPRGVHETHDHPGESSSSVQAFTQRG